MTWSSLYFTKTQGMVLTYISHSLKKKYLSGWYKYLWYWLSLGYSQISRSKVWSTQKEVMKEWGPKAKVVLPLHPAPGHQGCWVPRWSRKQTPNLWKAGPARLSVFPRHAWWGSEWASKPGRWLWLSGPTGRQCLNLGGKWLLNKYTPHYSKFYTQFQWWGAPRSGNQIMWGRVRELGGSTLGNWWAQSSTIWMTILPAASGHLKRGAHHAIPISGMFVAPMPPRTNPNPSPHVALPVSQWDLFPRSFICGYLPSSLFL